MLTKTHHLRSPASVLFSTPTPLYDHVRFRRANQIRCQRRPRVILRTHNLPGRQQDRYTARGDCCHWIPLDRRFEIEVWRKGLYCCTGQSWNGRFISRAPRQLTFEVQLLAPLPSTSVPIYCVGLNYRSHAKEAKVRAARRRSTKAWLLIHAKAQRDQIPTTLDQTRRLLGRSRRGHPPR